MTNHFTSLAIALLFAACDSGPSAANDSQRSADFGKASEPPTQVARFLIVVNSDYATTAISVLDMADMATADGQTIPPFASHVLHSGTKVGATSTALSGDVVLAHSSPGQRHALLIDRATGVLTQFDPRSLTVIRQISVATGFYSNPQDVLALASSDWLVSRMGRNPHPTADLTDYDDGDDVVRLRDTTIVGRIGLQSFATSSGYIAGPQQLAQGLGAIWLPVGSFSADFKAQGAARVVNLNATGTDIGAPVDLAAARNCVSVRPCSAERLVVACQGSFAKNADQISESAIFALEGASTAIVARKIAHADTQSGPWSRDFACAEAVVFAVSLGDLTTGRADQLWQIDSASGSRSLMAQASEPFGFSGIWFDNHRRVLWVGERNRKAGDLRRWSVPVGGSALEGSSMRSNPTGLGAVDLGGT